MGKKMKVARIATVPFALLGSKSLLEFLDKEVDLRVVCSNESFLDDLQEVLTEKIFIVTIKRDISLVSDLSAVFKLFKYFRKEKLDIVHSNTPKAGIIVALAAFLARVPCRCHTFTGQRWDTIKGWKKRLLIFIDKVICILNTDLYADGPSQITKYKDLKISKNLKIIGNGSFGGINLSRFSKNRLLSHSPEWLRGRENYFKIAFVGRVVKEKGVEDLLDAFSRLSEKYNKLLLVLIGPKENSLDPIHKRFKEMIEENHNIIELGFCLNPENHLAFCDLLCLPSRREGFPSVVLEAASLGLPAVVSSDPGCLDTIIEGKTGISFSKGKVEELIEAVESLCLDKGLCLKMGENAKINISKNFESSFFHELFLDEYKEIFKTQ